MGKVTNTQSRDGLAQGAEGSLGRPGLLIAPDTWAPRAHRSPQEERGCCHPRVGKRLCEQGSGGREGWHPHGSVVLASFISNHEEDSAAARLPPLSPRPGIPTEGRPDSGWGAGGE